MINYLQFFVMYDGFVIWTFKIANLNAKRCNSDCTSTHLLRAVIFEKKRPITRLLCNLGISEESVNLLLGENFDASMIPLGSTSLSNLARFYNLFAKPASNAYSEDAMRSIDFALK